MKNIALGFITIISLSACAPQVKTADATTSTAKDGKDGNSCSVKSILNGTKIECTDGTFSTIYNGLNFLSGSGVPSSNIGINDELYYDIVTYSMYKKTNGAWILVGNIKGSKGDTGDRGIMGTNGTNGTQGSVGQTGAKGDSGPAGPSSTNLIIYSNIPQNTCKLLIPGVYAFHNGTNVYFDNSSDCNNEDNENNVSRVYCSKVAQYFSNGDSTLCWIGRNQFTVMGTGANLKIYQVTY